MNIEHGIKWFKGTNQWASYSEQTQRQYSYLMENSLDLDIDGVPLREVHIRSVTSGVAAQIYTKTSERGVTVANQTRTAFSALFRTLTGSTPFQGAPLIAAGKQSINTEHLKKFLEVAYSKFKWRNAGLLVQMVYELGQDLTQLVELKWEDVDLKDGVVFVRGVALFMSDDLQATLEAQHKDFGFQQWVVPNPNIHKQDGYTPYGQTQLSRTIKKIKDAARLPEAFGMAEVKRMGFMAMLSDGYTREEMEIVAQPEDSREFKRTLSRLEKDLTA